MEGHGPSPGPGQPPGGEDWRRWHEEYDDPDSSLSHRRRAVQSRLRTFLDARRGPVRVASACAGDGRDLLEVLAERDDAARVTATLLEIDPVLADRAGRFAAEHDLRVDVRVADAGLSDSWAGAVPADLVMLCGVFGNIPDEDIRRTVAALPQLAAAGATVLWTRGRFDHDLTPEVAAWFEEQGCVRTAYLSDDRFPYRVVEHRYEGPTRPLERGERFFAFTR